MRPTLFISDLHLHQARSQTTVAFFRFLEHDAVGADALYILGDLFEFWVGDDQLDHDAFSQTICRAIRKLADRGVAIYFMHGNRDFLIGNRFADAATLTILQDPTTITIGERQLLLLHGDTLCTDDVAYQKYRAMVRDPRWQSEILAKPYAVRVALAQSIREQSDTEKTSKAEDIMDVSPATVEAVFREHDYVDMIHGHTHRSATHTHVVDEHRCRRTVLADWHDAASFLFVERTAAGIMKESHHE